MIFRFSLVAGTGGAGSEAHSPPATVPPGPISEVQTDLGYGIGDRPNPRHVEQRLEV